MNACSGRRAAQERQRVMQQVLADAGCEHELLQVLHPRQMPDVIERAVGLAQTQGRVLVAAGGDGTINAVVQRCLGKGVVFAALPQGTFNFFGRNHRLSEHLETAVRDLLEGKVRPIQVGKVNDHVFLINASIGLYRRLLQDREAFKRRLGRSRLVALWAGINTLLRPHPRLCLAIQHDGETRLEQVLTLVAGNNRLQLESLGLEQAAAVDQGQLLGLRVRPQPRWSLFNLALRGLLGQWVRDERAHAFLFEQLEVTALHRRRLWVAIDGELVRMDQPLRFQVAAERLPLLVPRRIANETTA
ncbi:diacylglycerol/lipid kinase family protein [Pseudomarimonas arenosa]|uniref:Diacylglycerol kinase n=1 Tax=Pseudomarimonas arenosa TaxID=2774145 RepID=A0AAW3ZLE4_9GAMM|nr:diacylglycerol kinase family protein [Pseudomarimonas arenosa]MBD8525236.1 diacylglycerol kinase [Pseudomarimonas arenosa]